MDGLTIAVISGATAVNFISVKVKFDKHRYSDAILDLVIFAAISFMFAGTMSGLTIGMVSSAMLSTYLWFSPPKEFFKVEPKKQQKSSVNSGAPGEGALEAFLTGISDIKRGL